ncbi:YigZ family protein [Mesonia sp. HuA40]|uniref:IMPACT family protein n=1 Tax=Mesonia sp. HuA40 TaxID=2602761 RepID=UPI002105C0E1|nr:YigZ family protein [Mesonia sp. HuA40]
MKEDAYLTLLEPGKETLYKEKGSKFYGYAFPVQNEAQIQEILTDLKTRHHKARHWCYAWQLGIRYENYRANDDGEPNNSAGMPIYGQLQAFNVTQVLVVVVRYFGGTKLGVGGLISAYKTSAQMALEASKIIKKTIKTSFQINFEYPLMNQVMRILKEEQIEPLTQEFLIACKITFSVRKTESEKVFEKFNKVYGVKIKKINE